MRGWETVEHWQARSELGVSELWLQRLDSVYSQAWRVEWGKQGGSRRGASFAGDDREQKARAEIERRKAAYKGDGNWEKVG